MNAIANTVIAPDDGLAQVLAAIMERYAERPAVGERVREITADPDTGRRTLRLLPRYATLTYRQLWQQISAVAADWHHHPTHPIHPGDRVCILGFTSIDYLTLDLACVHLGAVTVPLQSSASAAQLEAVVSETAPRILATTTERLDSAVTAAQLTPSVERVVVFDHSPGATLEATELRDAHRQLASTGRIVDVVAMATVLERGRTLDAAPLFAAPQGEDPLALLIYTSGSTGTPKGAAYTQSLVGTAWLGFFPRDDAGAPETSLHYLPLSHLIGRYALMGSLARGGLAQFAARSDLSTLFADLALVRPTELALVPRVCDLLFERYQHEMACRAGQPGDLEAQVRQDLRDNVLGGRVAHAVVGAAPLSAPMTAFMQSLLNIPMHSGYGATEIGRVMLDNRILRPPVTDYKLIDVPELGYLTSDTPHPRGELLIKTTSAIDGYYNRPDLNAVIFDAEGYYRTGDIMAEIAPDHLHYVDRRNNVLKLSQGEFVAVSRLETLFTASPEVRQIFVYGNSQRARLMAVVVPSATLLTQTGTDIEALRWHILDSLHEIGRQSQLQPYEIPRDVLIETEPFSTENGLLSDMRKPLRPQLTARYGERLEQLYAAAFDNRDQRLKQLHADARNQPLLDTIRQGAGLVLGQPADAIQPSARFTDLGGDSLSALSFAVLLGDVCGIDVPVTSIISPTADLAALARHIEQRRTAITGRPPITRVHALDHNDVHATELTLDKFLDVALLDHAPHLPEPAPHATSVLITGATGYLGRFVCLEWMERMAATGGTVVCLVRAANDTEAARRLESAYDCGGSELLDRYRDLAKTTLQVHAGDLNQDRMGLGHETWTRLANSTDLIVHTAALVNHVLPYQQLFGPNVAGTAEVIRLALTTRLKPITYLSTISIAGQSAPSALHEDADIRLTCPTLHLDDSYANGYAISKWAGEVLLREAHERFALPVTTFRSSMVLAHHDYPGQLNVPDLFTRLLLSVTATRLAPISFYRQSPHPDPDTAPRPHYDGLPVDFSAAAITALGDVTMTGYRNLNLVNPHDDGISLDTIVDWLLQAGHPIRRVPNYTDWLDQFETALRALPHGQRRNSLLPILHAFAQPAEPTAGSLLSTTRFQPAVEAAFPDLDNGIPHLTRALLGKYLADLAHLKLL
ncbi:carboxylic acid reductase [Streptomyces sp. NPDC050523]|uniref:carboxylic acid reductase n=1 Tax=Streptomyces sp. NPDC050523 TaxID=3365622 RepID=UPI00378C6110